MTTKRIKLKNATGDYLEPYTTNVPDASTSAKGVVQLETTPTANSTKVLTSGAVKTALDGKLGTSATAAKATADASGNTITSTYATKTEVQTAQTTANEAKSIAEGRTRATAYTNYQSMITAVNAAAATDFKVGDNIFIQAKNVPDLWIYSVESTTSSYTYTSDDALVAAIQSAGFVQIGYYKVAVLETEKVDLTNYVPATRTVNGKALSSNITLSAADVGALASTGTAAKATADADGNTISTTYLKISDAISYEEMA